MDNLKDKFAIEIVGKHIKDFYVRHVKEAIEKQVDFSEYGTPKEVYLKEVFRLYMIIYEALDRLKYTEIYLSIGEVPGHFLSNGIKEIEYYRHHIEFFHIKCISIFDYSVNLLNHSLMLGIPIRKCNMHSITENTNLKGYPILDKLKKFNNEINKIKRDRNIIIHEGDFQSISLNEIDSKIISNDLLGFGDELSAYFNKEKENKIKETVSLIKKNIENIENHVNELCDDLIPIIDSQIVVFELFE